MKKRDGITIVSLVITIILLLILAGISISSLTNQGIFKNANEAKDRTENAQKYEQELLNQYEDELNKYVGKLAEKVKPGDYIKYIPDTASTDTILQELNTYSGSSENTISTLTQEDLNWRVLDVKDGQVRLISELPTKSTITLNGYNGYNNAVKLLDDTCNVLYNNSKLVSKVQNLKIEDIQDKMIETDYSKIKANYGKIFTPTNKYYPSILLKEKEQKVNGTAGTELDLSGQKELINQKTKPQANSLDIKFTYWGKKMEEKDFLNSIYYKLFINKKNEYLTYFISSRCTLAYDSHAHFQIHIMNSGSIDGPTLYLSNGEENSLTMTFRPVITLNTNVKIDIANSGDGSTAEQAYAIK